MSAMKEVSATGTVVSSRAPVHSVILSAGIDAASVVLRDGGGAGTVKVTLKAAAGTSAVWNAGDRQGVDFATDVHATITGTTPTVDVEFD